MRNDAGRKDCCLPPGREGRPCPGRRRERLLSQGERRHGKGRGWPLKRGMTLREGETKGAGWVPGVLSRWHSTAIRGAMANPGSVAPGAWQVMSGCCLFVTAKKPALSCVPEHPPGHPAEHPACRPVSGAHMRCARCCCATMRNHQKRHEAPTSVGELFRPRVQQSRT